MPVGDGVSGVFPTLIEVSNAIVCPNIISGKAKYASGTSFPAKAKNFPSKS